ncbi:APC family permease [Zhihengliuella sp.]|uniref:APC family permease n=1 Tax=Zhihengliuella sp. TaxID=1954483 RepID=UPI002811BF36|nr:APC family permease [Zhihengliuella sp.]
MTASSASRGRLERRLGPVDATAIGVGSMVGAGVFVVLAPAARASGGLLLVAVLVAAGLALANALSTAALASVHPTSGGAYAYGRHELGAWPGFVAGWGFVTGKTASCAAMALALGTYIQPGAARLWASAAVVAVTAVNLLGVTRTAAAAKLLVLPVLAVLVWVGAAALGADPGSGASAVTTTPGLGLSSDAPADGTVTGVLQAAGLLFFAYAGYARVATLGEEVRNPRRTIPLAVVAALTTTVLLYLLLAVAVSRFLGLPALAASPAPVADAATGLGIPAPVVVAAACVAILGALLSLVAGVSRTLLAMAREGDVPADLARIASLRGLFSPGPHPPVDARGAPERHAVPWAGQLAVGVVVLLLVQAGDLTTVIGFSSFGVLVYYGVANLAAWRLGARRPWYCPRWVPALGAVACTAVAFLLPSASVLTMLGVFAVGIVYRLVRIALRRPAD